jgi:hypothetical protein
VRSVPFSFSTAAQYSIAQGTFKLLTIRVTNGLLEIQLLIPSNKH